MPWAFVFRAGGTAPPHPSFGEAEEKLLVREPVVSTSNLPGIRKEKLTVAFKNGKCWCQLKRGASAHPFIGASDFSLTLPDLSPSPFDWVV